MKSIAAWESSPTLRWRERSSGRRRQRLGGSTTKRTTCWRSTRRASCSGRSTRSRANMARKRWARESSFSPTKRRGERTTDDANDRFPARSEAGWRPDREVDRIRSREDREADRIRSREDREVDRIRSREDREADRWTVVLTPMKSVRTRLEIDRTLEVEVTHVPLGVIHNHDPNRAVAVAVAVAVAAIRGFHHNRRVFLEMDQEI